MHGLLLFPLFYLTLIAGDEAVDDGCVQCVLLLESSLIRFGELGCNGLETTACKLSDSLFCRSRYRLYALKHFLHMCPAGGSSSEQYSLEIKSFHKCNIPLDFAVLSNLLSFFLLVISQPHPQQYTDIID